MYKQKELIMLQTNESSIIHAHPKGLMYQSIEPFIQKDKDFKSYHLYILDDEKLKNSEENWNYIFGIQKGNIWRRIIASTNISLSKQFLQIPESFIKYFISEYNKDNIITNVMIDYKDNSEENWIEIDFVCLCLGMKDRVIKQLNKMKDDTRVINHTKGMYLNLFVHNDIEEIVYSS